MKQKIYIETSVVSYLVARQSRNIVIAAHQAATIEFWDLLGDYEVFVSDIVIQESAGLLDFQWKHIFLETGR